MTAAIQKFELFRVEIKSGKYKTGITLDKKLSKEAMLSALHDGMRSFHKNYINKIK